MTNWVALAFLALILVLLAFNKDTVIALYAAPVWAAILVIGYLASRSHHAIRTETSTPAGDEPNSVRS